MNKRPMTTGDWIVTGGLLLLLAGAVVTLFVDSNPEGTTQERKPLAAGAGPQAASNALLTPAGQESLRMVPVVATTRADAMAGGRDPTGGMVLLQKAPRVNFSGQVQQVSEQPQSDGQLHLWLQDPQGKESRISVGPGWFLTYLGCPLRHDATVDGTGFTFEKGGQVPMIYAKWIRMDGRTCQLRNDEGFALWSNKLR
ncbi:magnetosome protein MamS [Candidatus Magnetaquicoccus inordinatus]|uniref:magnetosome protein MamS n=1 Tax=Candidatus Magnetaquicoccus inordinatus TaxID=2496818 RepID=UPI00102C9799|nr:magnetosome protein MamS [Candidatus Magnetaquicoccus inordinatus]